MKRTGTPCTPTHTVPSSIRESVDSLYRDDTGEISRDPRTKRLKTRWESLPRPSKHTSNSLRAHIYLYMFPKTSYAPSVIHASAYYQASCQTCRRTLGLQCNNVSKFAHFQLASLLLICMRSNLPESARCCVSLAGRSNGPSLFDPPGCSLITKACPWNRNHVAITQLHP